jgi:hypothetical protein
MALRPIGLRSPRRRDAIGPRRLRLVTMRSAPRGPARAENLAQTATGSGDKRRLAGEIEEGSLISCAPPPLRSAGDRDTIFIRFGSRACRRSNHCGPSLKRSDGRDQRSYLDLAGGDEFHRLWIFSGGGAGALQAYLAGDDLLQREALTCGEMLPTSVTVPPFADAVDCGADGFVAADGFEDDVDAAAVRSTRKHLRR